MSIQSRDSATWERESESDRSVSQEPTMYDKQWVCTTCGYNMIDEMPDVCPFCGARHDKFTPWYEAAQTYRVTSHRVNDYVTQLLSVPRLGFEHAAYRIETEAGAVWIDCPSAFNRDLKPVEAICFTHKDFLGASNQYRELWNTQVHLHALDTEFPSWREDFNHLISGS